MTFEYDIAEIDSCARTVLENLRGRIVRFEGAMGAGKTTLIKAIAGAMGARQDEVNSPTFSIVNEYPSRLGTIYHFDFYRIKNEREAIDLGLFDYIDSGAYCFMEWAELVENLLPDEVETVRIEHSSPTKRVITIE